MKAAIWYGDWDIRVEQTEEPVVTQGTVKIKTEWCGICGSDLHEYVAGPMTIPVSEPHPLIGEITVGYNHVFPEVISLIKSQQLNGNDVITKKIYLDRIVEEGFRTLIQDRSHAKILITPKT